MSGTITVDEIGKVPAVPDSNTTLIADIMSALMITIADGQTGDGNIFADHVQGVIVAYSAFGVKPSPYYVVQSMFRGMFEASGLAVNGYWSSKLFENANPKEFLNSTSNRRVDGNLNYSFYGWIGNVQSMAGLVPFTIIIIISLVLLVQSYERSRLVRFDPSSTHSSINIYSPDASQFSDPLHIMVASAAGGLREFSGANIEAEDVERRLVQIQYRNNGH